MITGMIRCETFVCRFNYEGDCRLKEVFINEFGLCAFFDIIEKEQKKIFIESSECDSIELLSAKEEWISTHFKFLKEGSIFRVFKNGKSIIINNKSEFITTSDAYRILKPNNPELDIFRVNINVDS